MKKIMFCLILLLCFAGCGSPKAQSKEVAQTNKSLTFAVPETMEDQYTTAIEAYKKLYPEVDLEVVTYPYNEMEAVKEMRKKMAADLMAGKGYDIYIMAGAEFEDVQKVKASGAFENLYPYFEQDETFKKEDYLESIFTVEQKEGECHLLPYGLSVNFLGTKREILKETGIDLEGCGSYGDQIACMEAYLDLYPDRAATAPMGGFYDNLVDLGFVPWRSEKNEEILDSPVLKRAETLYKAEELYGEIPTDEYMVNEMAFLQEGKNLAMMFFNQPDFGWLCMLGGDQSGIIVPELLENGKTKAEMDTSKMAGIASGSPNKKNAWNFLKVLLDEEYQQEATIGGLPVKKSVLDQWFAAQEQLYVQDRVLIAEESYPGVSKEQIEKVKEQIYQAEVVPVLGYGLRDKYRECMAPYYHDEKTVEECLKEFRNYMEIYYSE